MLDAGRTIGHVVASAALVAGLSATAGAQQQRELFHWSGTVDQEVELTMSGQNLTTSNLGTNETGQRRVSVLAGIPRMDGQVTVQVADGRGTVDVVKQPTAENGYTTVIRIRDPQIGASPYRINAYWQPVAAGEIGPPLNRGGSRVALQWNGNVDESLLITLRPNGVSYRTPSGEEPSGIQSSFNGLPAGVSNVDIVLREGRGQVNVIQQPSVENGHTAVIRVRDPDPGFGHYSFDVRWE